MIHFDYTWTSTPEENPPSQKQLDNMPLDRMNGESVLAFINDVARRARLLDKRSGRQMERMVRVYPGELESRKAVREWVGENWGEFEGVTYFYSREDMFFTDYTWQSMPCNYVNIDQSSGLNRINGDAVLEFINWIANSAEIFDKSRLQLFEKMIRIYPAEKKTWPEICMWIVENEEMYGGKWQ